MHREQLELDAPGLDRPGTVIRYGHYGRPVIVFPSEQGRAWDYESNGMVGAVSHLIDEGRVKLYCVDSFDHASWSDREPARSRSARGGTTPTSRGSPTRWRRTSAPTAPARATRSSPVARWAATTPCRWR